MQYKEAMTELQTIVRRVEGSEVDVDELATAVRAANKLIAECRQKLRNAEEEVAKALEDMRTSGEEQQPLDAGE
jgi:exodeoxyribonuclease VII small subunit